MAKYIDVEPLMNGGWQLQRYNSGNGYVNQEHASLKDIPPADVRPVVRGRWTADGNGYHWVYVCSVCGWKDGYPFNARHNFCPNCGADMRGAQDE